MVPKCATVGQGPAATRWIAEAPRVLLFAGERAWLGAGRDNPCTSLQTRFPSHIHLSFLTPAPPFHCSQCFTDFFFCTLVCCPGHACGAQPFEALVLPFSLSAVNCLPHGIPRVLFLGLSSVHGQCWEGWGSFYNGNLGTDLRHCSCWGKSKREGVYEPSETSLLGNFQSRKIWFVPI